VSATIFAPASTPPQSGAKATREQLLAVALDPSRLPSPPAVALQVVNAASRPACDPAEIVTILGTDAALCGKLLKAVNSCLYSLKQPVASVARAVQVLGLKTIRSLALGLSLPAVKANRGAASGMRDYWLASVGGAIIARELAVVTRRPGPEDDLVAGLLRDLGEVLLRQAFSALWDDHLARHAERIVDDPCGAEVESFGIDHADVSAELLRVWQLPADLVEPIRHHHGPVPASLSQPQRERAELLHFASQLVNLDAVAQRPDLLERLLATSRDRFGLPQQALVEFLKKVAPKIEEFAGVLNQDVGQCPNFAAVLAAGAVELANLTVERGRQRQSGTVLIGETNRSLPPATQSGGRTYAGTPLPAQAAPAPVPGARLPEFRLEFLEKLPEGGCRIGTHELRSLIGRGATGVVFKAFDPILSRTVAVKVLAPELAALPGARHRFAREARLASVQNENVVAIYAVRELREVPYLVMEFVDGGCLEARVQQHGSLPVLLVAAAAHQIAAGLAAAHVRGVVHGDLKPANVLLDAETGRAKVGDFGLVRVAEGAGGTPFYTAPEVAQGETATTHSDLFSLGCVLYVMATGRVPFPGQSVAEVFTAVTSAEPVLPRQLRPALPEWLETIILRLLSKDPAARPSAAAVAALFAEAVG
jgi:HD-like signal output (HDOD) protein